MTSYKDERVMEIYRHEAQQAAVQWLLVAEARHDTRNHHKAFSLRALVRAIAARLKIDRRYASTTQHLQAQH